MTQSAELIAQSKAVQAESLSLRAQASLLRSESDAARRRVAKQRECAEKISQRANRNRLKAPDAIRLVRQRMRLKARAGAICRIVGKPEVISIDKSAWLQ